MLLLVRRATLIVNPHASAVTEQNLDAVRRLTTPTPFSSMRATAERTRC
jgi:hypothetical protein